MKSKSEPPLKVGDRVSWEGDTGVLRKVGVVYDIQWMKTDGGFWRVSASSNGEPYHPILNPGPYRAASAKYFDAIEGDDEPEDVTVYRIDTLFVVDPHQSMTFDTLEEAIQYAKSSGIDPAKIRIEHVALPVGTVFDYTYLDEEGWFRQFEKAKSDYRKSSGRTK